MILHPLEVPKAWGTDLVKVAILAGGRGERLSEETRFRPKPMVDIGGRPLLWHIMMHYSTHGFTDFTIALGYKGNVIRDWFAAQGDQTDPLSTGDLRVHWGGWQIDLIDTGPAHVNTGGRIKALAPHVGADRFLLTWGDGVSDVDLTALAAFHATHGKIATMTAVRPPPRFGHLTLDGDRITAFNEKPPAAEGWINGAFFVLEPGIFARIDGPETPFEGDPLQGLARDGQLMAYRHPGFWHCMDTLNDKDRLEAHWASGDTPWVTWASEGPA